jgi:DNA-binding NtrC family response regulator
MTPQRRLLVVDDEKNIRLTLSQTLASDTTTVETAVNGEEALQRLEGSSYDLMLLDLKMPGMDGLEALRRARQLRPQLPVIVLTAHGTVESAVEAMRIGAANFIQKPFSPREIRSVVEQALASRPGAGAAPSEPPKQEEKPSGEAQP